MVPKFPTHMYAQWVCLHILQSENRNTAIWLTNHKYAISPVKYLLNKPINLRKLTCLRIFCQQRGEDGRETLNASDELVITNDTAARAEWIKVSPDRMICSALINTTHYRVISWILSLSRGSKYYSKTRCYALTNLALQISLLSTEQIPYRF